MNSKDRSYLRSLAQKLDCTVMVGKAGETRAVADALDSELNIRELVKLRFQNQKERTREIALSLAETTGAQLVATTGFTAVFFRPAKDPSRRQIRLPSQIVRRTAVDA